MRMHVTTVNPIPKLQKKILTFTPWTGDVNSPPSLEHLHTNTNALTFNIICDILMSCKSGEGVRLSACHEEHNEINDNN